MQFKEFHRELSRTIVGACDSEDELFLWMVLLHTHNIQLADDFVLDDAPHAKLIHPVTQRAASEVIAELWSNRADVERTDDFFWYRQFADRDVELVIKQHARQIEEFRKRLEADPRIKAVKRE